MKKKTVSCLACLGAVLLCLATGCGEAAENKPTETADTMTAESAVSDTEEPIIPEEDSASVETSPKQAEYQAGQTDTADTVSIEPEDYGLTEAMLSAQELPDFAALSLEALGAYYLHTDGAGAEGSGDELYHRFLSDPETVLRYMERLGNQTARGGPDGTYTAAGELCHEIAFADVFWYDKSDVFDSTVQTCKSRFPSGRIAELIEAIQGERDAAARLAS